MTMNTRFLKFFEGPIASHPMKDWLTIPGNTPPSHIAMG